MDIVKVVHDHEQLPTGIASPQAFEGIADLFDAFSLTKDPIEAVSVDIVEAEELLGTLVAMVRGAHAMRPAPRRPGDTTDRAQLQRPPLVEADYRGPGWALTVESANEFFLVSKWGSFDVFQDRMRCAEKPSRLRSRLTHSSVTSGRTRFVRQ